MPSTSSKLWVLCDIDAAYVSFIQLFNPQFDIATTPLAVLSSNQGNVVARNQPVKDLGVKMGEPAHEALPKINRHKGHVWGSNFELFGDMSGRFHNEVANFVNDPIRYSVDESFGLLDVNYTKDIKGHVLKMQQTLKRNLGLSCGIGVSRTKTLAKLASHCAKQRKWRAKTHGVVVLDTQEKIEWALARVKVDEIWGVGKKTAEKLNAQGVVTGLDLKRLDVNLAKQQFTVVLARTIEELNSRESIELKDINSARDRLCVSQSMGIHVTDLNTLKEAMTSHVTNAAIKLRRFKSYTSQITVFMNTDVFRKGHAQHTPSLTVTLPYHTADTEVLVKYALFGLQRMYREGYKYKKVGVILERLVKAQDHQQLNLFEDTKKLEVSIKTKVSDEINERFGAGAIRLGSQGFKAVWRPKDDLAPKNYTTAIGDIPTAYAK
ncbi:Y-family DNA polymerase [uncultured Pseudoalteromonas sp.]|uniref:Y-family DNA polymerase n=1 Tax=uncultured Pseudoalteromonas sp. TaxID=114053 RepID=UPI00259869FD|nr:Y-family DNA polymerase [uncultured Pseudoalteromonas sp.]